MHEIRSLMYAQIKRELELAHEPEVTRLRNALEGISTCATQCGCCRMHVQIALEALKPKEKT